MENGSREVRVPAGGLVALRRALREEAGPLATIHTLHTAGFAAGEALFPALLSEVADGSDDPSTGSAAAFWTGVSRFLARRGWGSLTHEKVHDGVAVLTSPDWVEVGDAGERQPTCAFSTGMLSALLTRAAEHPVAVVEVACRAAGDESCRFAFGSEVAIHELYGRLLEDRDLEAALAAL